TVSAACLPARSFAGVQAGTLACLARLFSCAAVFTSQPASQQACLPPLYQIQKVHKLREHKHFGMRVVCSDSPAAGEQAAKRSASNLASQQAKQGAKIRRVA